MPSVLLLSRMKNLQAFNLEWLKDFAGDFLLITTENPKIEHDRFKVIEEIRDYETSGLVELAAMELFEAHHFSHIVSTSETDVVRSARLRTRLGLPGQELEGATAFRDKVIMKEHIRHAGMKVPAFARLLSPLVLISFVRNRGYPLVVKPVDGAASVDTVVLRQKGDLEAFLSQPWRPGFEAESFVEGTPCHVDGFVYNDEVLFTWPSRYLTSCLSFKDGGYTASCMLEPGHAWTEYLREYSKCVLRALPGKKSFSFHLEVFVSANGEITFLEIAARTGGARVNSIIEQAFGFNLNELFVRSQVGLPIDVERIRNLGKAPSTVMGWAMVPPRPGAKPRPQLTVSKEPWIRNPLINKSGFDQTAASGSVDHIASYEVTAETSQDGLNRIETAYNSIIHDFLF